MASRAPQPPRRSPAPLARRGAPPRYAKGRRPPPRGRRRPVARRNFWGATGGGSLAIAACILLVVTVLPLCLVVFAGMAPTIAAAVADRHPRRFLLRSVATCNVAGMVQPIGTLLHAGLTVYGAATVLFDPYQWLWMYGSSALGWVAYLGMPPLMRYIVEGRALRTEKELQERAKALIEEWGDEVDPRKSDLVAAMNAAVAAAGAKPAANAGGAGKPPVSRGGAGAPSPST
jgi:hypothetical protein